MLWDIERYVLYVRQHWRSYLTWEKTCLQVLQQPLRWLKHRENLSLQFENIIYNPLYISSF